MQSAAKTSPPNDDALLPRFASPGSMVSVSPRCKICRDGLEKAKDGLLLCSTCCIDDFSTFKRKIGKNEELQIALEPFLQDKSAVVATALKNIVIKEADAVSFRQICAGNARE